MSSDDLAANAPLLLDRFVSASTAQDVYLSLEQILESIQAKHLTASDIYSENEVPQALLQVLQTGSYKDLPIEEGSSLAARIFQELAKDKTAPVLMEPSEGRLLETLVDVASDSESTAYPRVLCLQTLRSLCQSHSKLAQSQLLRAPNGLHRLGDLLQVSVDEQVRNEALLLAAVVAEWPSAAKVWMFSEVGDVVIQLAMEEGGLTGGNVLVLDCLSLLRNMLKHDAALADLVFQSPVLAQNLVRLLDLRRGKEFMYPKQPQPQEEEDDLDDLIQSGSKKKEPTVLVPKLTPSEEKVIEGVFDILSIVMESDSVKQMVWKKQTALVSLVWEMGLFYPPAPGTPYSCAVPSIQLQQRALQVTALYFSHAPTMEHHNGLDRLNLLVCTGGSGQTFGDRMALSQSALHVIRRTLTSQAANEMLLHTMAPAMDDDGDQAQPKEATVVQKLLNTCFENMVEPNDKDIATEERRKIFLAGSFGALALFLTDEASRSVLLRLTSGKVTLMDSILETLASNEDNKDDFVSLVLLRFLCHWIIEAPIVVQAMLLSTHSVALNVLFMSKQENVSTLTSLLLGLAMEYMGDESKCGGWTRNGMMEMVQKRGLSRFNSKLEQFKSIPKKELPWSCCYLEWQVWSKFYEECVLVVRKRVVQALTAGGEEIPDEGGDEAIVSTSASVRSLQQLVSQQSAEIEQLRESLDKAEKENASKEKALVAWKLRVESTPTELDDMLSEYTSKNIVLDQRISELEEELRVKDEKYQSELKERNEKIDSVQEELQESHAREVEAREERDSLREDMTALSQAYSSLEEEYRRQAESTSTAAAAPTGEEEDAGRQQPEGEVSQQTPKGSTEVATLRAENSRLQQDARAADDWMAMAVERMNAMGQQNASLQQEVTSLREQLEHTGNAPSDGTDETAGLLLEERQRRAQLEAELSQERTRRGQAEGQVAQSSQSNEELHKESLHRQELESQLHNLRLELQLSTDSLDKLKAERGELVQSVEGLNEDLDRARKEVSSLRESRSQDVGLDGEEGEDDTTHQLRNQLSLAQTELERLRQREQESIHERDLISQGLDSRPNDVSEQLTIEDIRSRDEEIEKLREANDAAQEWMAKAVEHNQAVSERLAKVSEENASLSTQVRELTEKLQSSQNASTATESERVSQLAATIENLQEQLEAKEQEANGVIAQWQQSYSAVEVRCAELQSQLESSEGATEREVERDASRIKELEALVESLQKDMRVQEEKATSVIADWSKSYSAVEDKLAELSSVWEEKEQLAKRCISLEQQFNVVEREKAELLQNAAALLESKDELESLREENEELSAREQQSRDDVARLQDQLREIEDKVNDESKRKASDRILELETTVESLRKELKAQEDNATSVISQWQQSYAEVESQFTDLKCQFDALEIEKGELLARQGADQEHIGDTLKDREDLSLRIKELESQLASSSLPEEASGDEMRDIGASGLETSEPEEHADVVAVLESTIRSLKEELESQNQEAYSAINQWQESYSGLESHAAELESQLVVLREETEKLREQPHHVPEAEDESELGFLRKEKGELVARDQQSRDELSRVQSELTDLQRQLTQMSSEDAGHVERIRQLEAELDSLRQQKETEEQEATTAVEQWRDSYTTVESQLEAVTKERDELCNLKIKTDSELEGLRKEKEELLARDQQSHDELSRVQSEHTDLQTRLTETSSEDAGHVERIRQLEAELDSLRQQIEAEELEATTVVEQWRDSYTTVELQLEAVTKERDELCNLKIETDAELEGLRKEKEELLARDQQSHDELSRVQSELTDLQTRLTETPSEDAGHVERIRQLEAELDSLRQQIEAEEQEATTVVEQWRDSYTTVESQLEAVTEERDELCNLKIETDAELEGLRKEKEELLARDQHGREELTKVREELAEIQGDFSERSRSADHVAQRNQDLENEIVSLQQQLVSQETESESITSQWQQRYSLLETQVKDLESQLALLDEKERGFIFYKDKAESELTHLREEKEELLARDKQSHDELSKVQLELTDLQTRLVETSSEDAGHVERILQLEAELDSLRQQIDAEEQEATTVVEQWRDSYTTVELQLEAITKERDELCNLKIETDAELERLRKEKEELLVRDQHGRDELTKVREELAEIQGDFSERSRSADHVGQRNQDLENKIGSLQQQLVSQETEAESVISQWQQSYSVLEIQVKDLESQLATLEEKQREFTADKDMAESELAHLRKEKDEVCHQNEEAQKERDEWSKRYEQSNDELMKLRSELKVAQSKLEGQEKDASNVVSEWEKAYVSLESQLADLEHQLSESSAEKDELVARCTRLEQQLDATRKEKEDLTAFKAAIEYELGDLRKERDDLVTRDQENRDNLTSAKARIGEAEAKLSDMESQSREADEVVQQWAESYSELEAQLTETESQLTMVSKEMEQTKADADLAISSWEANCMALQRKLEENEELFASRLEAKLSEHVRARESVDAQRLLEREHNEQLECERDELRSQRASLEEERDRLKIQLVELEDELRAANDALPLHVTNEVSEKATEIAAKALRHQVHELRSKLEEDSKAFSDEHEARLVAEQEATRLRGDLAALLGMEDNEDTRGEIQRRTVEATAQFQRNERAEIEELKQALVLSLDELDSARNAVKDSDERAAKASLQASMYEQEVVTVKSDFKFLSQAMEEARDAESTRRGALEHRIASLERDNSVLRRCHAAEIENLRNELDQITMERDRIFQSLRESEKNKEALLHAKVQSSAGEENPEAELVKLRLEKAQLLSAAAEEASRAERRLREARAAEKATAESDVLLEKELRIAAEKALENVKLEMEDLRKEANGKKIDSSSQDARASSDLEKEVENLKEEIKLLSEKNNTLQSQLEEAMKESKSQTEKLAEALTKLHSSQRNQRYEAEVRVEVARLQALHRKDVDNGYQVNPAEDESDDGVIDDNDDGPAAQLYDVIEKQKTAIEEERSMYRELLAEQDDLLALLAQQDLIRDSLNAALVRLAGQEAVDEAIREAEKEAVAKFGKYVKLT